MLAYAYSLNHLPGLLKVFIFSVQCLGLNPGPYTCSTTESYLQPLKVIFVFPCLFVVVF